VFAFLWRITIFNACTYVYINTHNSLLNRSVLTLSLSLTLTVTVSNYRCENKAKLSH
jgi:hypothetical protein